MRTERDLVVPVQIGGQTASMEGSLTNEVEAYVTSALRVEHMALDLAQRKVEGGVAVRALIEAADEDVRVMRRALRHCEFAMSKQWPAGHTLIRAFDYLSAGRRELDAKRSQGAEAVLQASSKPTADREPRRVRIEYDLVDEASLQSFPASDAPSFWGW